MVRWSATDEGKFTEFKTPSTTGPQAVQRLIREGADQVAVEGGGEVVVDGRPVGLGEAGADAQYDKAQDVVTKQTGPGGNRPDATMPERVRFILADNTMYTRTRGDR
jgi:hypothetical protein